MSFQKSLAGICVGLTLTVAPLTVAPLASADTISASQQSITRAADWVATDFTTNCTGGNSSGYDCTNGGLADAIMALSAANDPKYAATLAQMSVQLQPQVAAYTSNSPAGTAKIIITAEALHMDPTDYGGVNLVKQLNTELAETGPGAYWGPSLSVIALARTGQQVPSGTLDALLALQDPASGGFGWQTGTTWNTDGDNTAVGLMATSTQAATSSQAAASLQKAIQWSTSPANVTTDSTGTYWSSYSPVNTTGRMLGAIGDVHDSSIDASAQMTWLEGQQLSSGAFGASLGSSTDNAMATTQALLGLTKTGYVTVSSAAAFADVPPSNQFFAEIEWVFNQQIATGWVQPDGSRLYQPLDSITRDAVAAYLYRLAGSPAYTPPTTSPFTDVGTSDAYYKEICWLKDQGITTGYPDGTFRPLDPVNRNAMAAFLYRLAGSPSYTPPASSPFTDVAPTDAFYKEMTWLASTGITTGWADGTYQPLTPVARNAMAAFLNRLYTNVTNPAA